jgi:NAD(P)H-hydrate epimerase
VRADVTVTFQYGKVGLWVEPGKSCAGRVEVVDIGIPSAGHPVSPDGGLIAPAVAARIPRRSARSNKFSSGRVLVVGGSAGLTGAVCLACAASMRSGAGWVRAAVPASLDSIFEVKLTEVMTVPLAEGAQGLAPGAAATALEAAERADCVVLGPGLGRASDTAGVAIELIERLVTPLLVDADGLNALAGAGLEHAAGRPAPTVLTPHAGELGRLLGISSDQVAAHRIDSVRRAAARAQAIVVLKGDDTIVVEPESDRLAVSAGGSPGLATAGTGDVLSGVIAAFLAKRVDVFTAVCAGVRVHADAGRVAAGRLGADSVIAGDVVEALAPVLRDR